MFGFTMNAKLKQAAKLMNSDATKIRFHYNYQSIPHRKIAKQEDTPNACTIPSKDVVPLPHDKPT